MKTILVYRHPQSEKNRSTRRHDGKEKIMIAGRASDSPLTPTGQSQAKEWLGGRLSFLLANGELDAERTVLGASTAKRAWQALEIGAGAAGLRGQVKRYEDLEELEEGPWTGGFKDEPLVLPDGTQIPYLHFHQRGLDYDAGGTESLRHGGQRVIERWREIASRTPEAGAAVIVGHALVSKVAVRLLTGIDTTASQWGFASETRLTVNNRGHWEPEYIALPTDVPCAPVGRAVWHRL